MNEGEHNQMMKEGTPDKDTNALTLRKDTNALRKDEVVDEKVSLIGNSSMGPNGSAM